jgi:ATP-dependent RNA helicase DDX52/ROK1
MQPLPHTGLLNQQAAAGGGGNSGSTRKKRRTAATNAAAQDDDHAANGGPSGISMFGSSKREAAVAAAGVAGTALPGGGRSDAAGGGGGAAAALPEVHTKDPNEEANAIRKALRIKVGRWQSADEGIWRVLSIQPLQTESVIAVLEGLHTQQTPDKTPPPARPQVSGGGAPCPLRSWEDLGARYKVGPRLRDALAAAGWLDPTPIQRQAVPALMEGARASGVTCIWWYVGGWVCWIVGVYILAGSWPDPLPVPSTQFAHTPLTPGRELLAIAPTGSGKTLAFLLPIVAALRQAHNEGGAAWPDAPKALCLSPTHELAGQTARVLKRLLPGTKLKACLLSKATAAGSDFSKVGRAHCWLGYFSGRPQLIALAAPCRLQPTHPLARPPTHLAAGTNPATLRSTSSSPTPCG